MSSPTVPQMPRKRGRPALWAKVPLGADGKPQVEPKTAKVKKELTDEQTLALVRSRFEVMAARTHSMVRGTVRSLIISGAPGVGKSYTIDDILSAAKEKSGTKFEIFHGTMTAINLFRTLHKYRAPGSIVVFDDTDSIFGDEAAMNLLKAACDTTKQRRLSYMSDTFTGAELGSDATDEVTGDIPQQFLFEGSIIFITNLDFEAFIAAGSNKFSKHMEALLNRSLYLDLLIHGRRELALWIGHILRTARVLQVDYELTEQNVTEILDYLTKNQTRVRSLSIRSALHCAALMKDEPKEWKKSADVLLLRAAK